MLTETQRKLWEAYEAAEGRAPRAEIMQALGSFLDALTESPATDWFPWARALCEQVVDQELDLIVRRPLFERVLFPALLAGYEARLPGCARWLAGLASHLSRSKCAARLRPEETTELGLLRAAIRHDPSDRRCRLRLIDRIADWLRFSIHEIPAGVLYGMDGASPAQCEELDSELNEFGRLVAEEAMELRYAELIRTCRMHYRGYRDYLVHRNEYESYAAYLSQQVNSTGS